MNSMDRLIDFHSWKNKEIIKDQEQIESTIKSIVLEHTKDETNWKEFSLSDSNIKFQVKFTNIARETYSKKKKNRSQRKA